MNIEEYRWHELESVNGHGKSWYFVSFSETHGDGYSLENVKATGLGHGISTGSGLFDGAADNAGNGFAETSVFSYGAGGARGKFND